MKTSLLPIITALLFTSLPSLHAQEWLWVTDETTVASGTAISHDPLGNIYVLGEFTGTAMFGNESLVSAGAEDAFLVKYTPDGDIEWGRRIGGPQVDKGIALETEGFGNSYVGGSFRAAASFGDSTRTSRGGEDLYFGIYTTGGDLKWFETGGGNGVDRANAVTIDRSFNLLVTGVFTGTMTLGDTTVYSQGISDVFVASYDSDGKRRFFQHWGARGGYAEGLAIRHIGRSIYIGGMFIESVTFGSTTFTDSTSEGDGFVVRLNEAGTVLWARQISGSGADYISGITSDGVSCTIVGGFHDTARIDTARLMSAGATDILIARLDTAGSLQWARRAGGTEEDSVVAIRPGASGITYVAGRFSGSAEFGDTTLSAAGTGSDIFVAKYLPTGTIAWAHRAGGMQDDAALGFDLDNRAILLTGFYSGTAGFDTITRTGAAGNFYAGRMTDIRRITVLTAPDTICTGTEFTMSFETEGVFAEENIYTAQLSDSVGSFASPVDVGVQPVWNISTIRITIPYRTPAGSGYRLRIVSSDPPRISQDNGEDFTIRDVPLPEITVNGTTTQRTFCEGTQIVLTASPGYAAYYWSTEERTSSILVAHPGDYYVLVVGENGCLSISDTIRLIRLPAPAAPMITQTGDVLGTDSLDNTEYQWNLDGVPVAGATGASYRAVQSGAYTVTITDTNGCSSTSDPLNVTITGITDLDPNESIRFSSRSIGNRIIAVELNLERAAMIRMSVTDLLGRELWQKESLMGSGLTSIDLSDQPAGVYLVSVWKNGEVWMRGKVVR